MHRKHGRFCNGHMKHQPSLHIVPAPPSVILCNGSSSKKEGSILQTIMYRELAASEVFLEKALLKQRSFLPISKCFEGQS